MSTNETGATTMTHPIDPEQFRNTAPAWNCVDHPGEGLHYTPRPGVGCAWCGKKPEQVHAETIARMEREQGQQA
jgi:hypothetical protein